ncbi:sugar transferase, PEP-CTERM system associated/exopolysaccharide biosynthesis polyprenyl glycosylphosphotransferase [Methylomagnum ishizawai]|uniref:Sugar transferase, PEP-CTERM system associated/exopolysaccharide biosynthesis polyprenyl glycosylphosphotransferase n=1 Tax=Methylomagnum ishizawai TaxID=1760988 RepID=A0A1Y6D770_9GAMM|nr:TIGR03013 family XrtA/PEP-CTERM system glycosyltransferase [Methylomagnum ishizawai]SMF96643.1 sugar transferase, PEP-CTERM system associated/exopolysaccharide biosynthesis polyprenyl glycosylphosphotransferase [Methylomagnum ishizawai]
MIRIFRHYVSSVYLLVFLLDSGTFFSAFYWGGVLRYFPQGMEMALFGDRAVASVIFTVIMLVSTTGMGLYERVQSGGDAGLLLRILGAFMAGTIVMGLVFYGFPEVFVGRGVFGYALLAALTLMLISRFVFLRFVDRRALRRRVLVLGAGYNANMIHDFEQRAANLNFWVVGFVQMGNEPCRVNPLKLCELKTPLHEFALKEDIDEIVVAPDDRRGGLVVDEILDCKMSGMQVVDLLSFFEREASLIRVDCLHPSWLVFSDGFQYSGVQELGKRAFDILASLGLLLVAWPIMLLASLAILLESGFDAPVFYRQTRVGKQSQPFRVVKFRSMRTDAEQDGKARWATQNDDRVTRVGRFMRKTRIDELPQLFNVLKGEMSFVGPRPERPEFVEKFAETIPYYAERHRIKPGITGWAQLCYPYGSGYQDAIEKLQYDLYYVKNYSLFLDFLIMLQTIEVVIWGKGAR